MVARVPAAVSYPFLLGTDTGDLGNQACAYHPAPFQQVRRPFSLSFFRRKVIVLSVWAISFTA